MKVVNVFYYYDEQVMEETEVIRRYYTTTGWAEALQVHGICSMVITRFMKNSYYTQNQVSYFFIKDRFGGRLRFWQLPLHLLRQVKALRPDVVHVHSLTLSLQTVLLRWLLPAQTAIVVQHHGGRSPGTFKRMLHNWLNQAADAFFFTTARQGADWFGTRGASPKVLPVMEGGTFFDYENRDADRPVNFVDRYSARRQTGLEGEPVFLWVGRLDDNKDPLTVLQGFCAVAEQHPSARLYMLYTDAPLLPAVTKAIQDNPLLRGCVHLSGHIPHAQVEAFYNSADYFVLGSHYEGAGYALSEALRCGCVPIVSDIPSFRMMTQEGTLGALWQPGNAAAFTEAARVAMAQPRGSTAQACMDHYQQQLSFEAIARVAALHYRQVAARRQRKA